MNRKFLVTILAGAVAGAAMAADVRSDVPLRGFYKDLYMDCGVGLTNLDSLPAASMLGWSVERGCFSGKSEASMQNAIIAGDSLDWNGHLLYPDGSPRFGMVYVNGGTSLEHGASLGEGGRRRLREFVKAGGAYVGDCAGAILAGQGYVGKSMVSSYLGIWPGIFEHTGKGKTQSDIAMPKGSPLLKYYNYGGDRKVANVRHNQGNYPASIPQGGQVLATYDWKNGGKSDGKPAVAAYKADAKTGRLVVCGSHPEGVTSGEQRDLMAAMLRYAAEGVGMTTIKGWLENGEARKMDRQTYEHLPEYTRIGDMQYHHFAVNLPKGARDVTFTLRGAEGSHMTLAVCHDTYAYDDCADFRSTNEGSFQQFTMARPKAGVWYVAVRCIDTVDVRENHHGQSYGKSTFPDLLNGVPYTIEVNWR